jgi:hypothetical protein
VDATAHQAVQARLDAIIAAETVAIPLAVESGSRAWGFPSPDSDYDCRFIFIRRMSDCLRLFPKRDVIEMPLSPVLDINGWELAKAIKLLLKGNAVVVEWLRSPIRYRVDEDFRDRMLTLAGHLARRDAIASHYLHILYSMRARVLAEPDAAPIKKLFYALRPAMALRWLRQRPEQALAPMNFAELCAESDLPKDLVAQIETLIERKSMTRELGHGRVSSAITGFIEAEAASAEGWIGRPGPPSNARKGEAEAAHLALLKTFAPP